MKTLIRWFILYVYRGCLRPVMRAMGGPLSGCRFHPSCSQYFLEAVEIHGVVKGCCLGIWRILRCNPWGGSGEDPVPPRREKTGHGENGRATSSSSPEPGPKNR